TGSFPRQPRTRAVRSTPPSSSAGLTRGPMPEPFRPRRPCRTATLDRRRHRRRSGIGRVTLRLPEGDEGGVALSGTFGHAAAVRRIDAGPSQGEATRVLLVSKVLPSNASRAGTIRGV